MTPARKRRRKRLTPYEHFKACGPFCPHVEICEACANLHALCSEHRQDPNVGIRWAKDTEEVQRGAD